MNAVLIIDKPAGLTSHDVVNRVRGILGERSVGHLGTLDPLATGVLPLVVGSLTRLAQFYTDSEKRYEGTVRFGFATDTYDAEGEPAGAPQAVRTSLSELQQLGAGSSRCRHLSRRKRFTGYPLTSWRAGRRKSSWSRWRLKSGNSRLLPSRRIVPRSGRGLAQGLTCGQWRMNWGAWWAAVRIWRRCAGRASRNSRWRKRIRLPASRGPRKKGSAMHSACIREGYCRRCPRSRSTMN